MAPARRAAAVAATRTLLVALALAVAPGGARADGEIGVRHMYYKEDSTRVQQPMVDATLDVGDNAELDGHLLIDSITSASVAAGMDGEPFNERRVEQGLHLTINRGVLAFGGGYRYSSEPDYRSLFLTADVGAELADRNTTLRFAFSYGSDGIGNENQTGLSEPLDESLHTYLSSLSVTQVVTPVVVVGMIYDLILTDGFQANPYRQVSVAGVKSEERVPDERTRHAVLGFARGFVEPSRTTLYAGYRFYTDDWGITAHTPELRVTQRITASSDVRVRYRYHHQTGADFYRDVYDVEQDYVVDDPKLGPMTTNTVGAMVGFQLAALGAVEPGWRDTRVELAFDYMASTSRFGDAVVGQIGVLIPLEY